MTFTQNYTISVIFKQFPHNTSDYSNNISENIFVYGTYALSYTRLQFSRDNERIKGGNITMTKLLAQHGTAKGKKMDNAITNQYLSGVIFSPREEKLESIKKYYNNVSA